MTLKLYKLPDSNDNLWIDAPQNVANRARIYFNEDRNRFTTVDSSSSWKRKFCCCLDPIVRSTEAVWKIFRQRLISQYSQNAVEKVFKLSEKKENFPANTIIPLTYGVFHQIHLRCICLSDEEKKSPQPIPACPQIEVVSENDRVFSNGTADTEGTDSVVRVFSNDELTRDALAKLPVDDGESLLMIDCSALPPSQAFNGCSSKGEDDEEVCGIITQTTLLPGEVPFKPLADVNGQ